MVGASSVSTNVQTTVQTNLETKPALVIQMLNGFCVRHSSGDELLARSKRLRLLFAFLLLHRKTPLSRERIAFELWPDSSESSAFTNLRSVLFRLRKELPDADRFFATTNDAVIWQANAPIRLDVAHFEDAMEQATSATDLAAALDLYAGPLLPACYEEWIVTERERLHLLYQDGLRRLIDLREQQQDSPGAIQAARQLLWTDPLREESYRRLMQIYARQRDRSGLEQVWQECVQKMEAELGLPPSPELVKVYERLQQAVVAETPNHNLTTEFASFVGREEDLRTLIRQLALPDCRLLTLVGPGGMGKSRLAQQVAQSLLYSYLHGVFFISLVDVTDISLMPALIADQLGLSIRGETSLERQVLGQLRDKEMLLVLDNYEHLLPHTRFLENLLIQAPGITLVITSRERLSLRWEWVYAVQGLPVYAGPIADGSTATTEQALRRMSSAVQLFVHAARRVRPSFKLDAETVGHLVEICELVEGMPLGIELAASWSRLLSAQQIHAHLQESMDLLTTSLRDIPERHRSLRAVFDNSWGLLNQAEREILAKLSVFRGGFTLASAAEVVGASVPMLAAMLDKSLLNIAQDGRYNQHDLLRKYAGERLAETPLMQQMVRDRHARYYAQHMASAAQKGIGTTAFMEMIAMEIGNIRQAWRWAMTRQDTTVLAHFIMGMGYFYEVQGWRQEASEVFTAAYEAMRPQVYPIALSSPAQIQVFATLLAYMGFFYPERDAEKSFNLESEALSLLRPLNDGLELATVLVFRGRSASDLGEYEIARQDLEEALAIMRRVNMWDEQSVPLQFLGINHRRVGRYEASIRCHRQALTIGQVAKIDRMTAAALNDLCVMALLQGEIDEAARLVNEALGICERSGDTHLQGLSQMNLGMVAYARGQYDQAQSGLTTALENHVFTEMNIQLAVLLAWLCRTHMALEEDDKARIYLIQALHTVLLPGFHRAFGMVFNTAGIFLADRSPDLAQTLWAAVQQEKTLYYENRKEAADLLTRHFAPEDSPNPARQPAPDFPALVHQTLAVLG